MNKVFLFLVLIIFPFSLKAQWTPSISIFSGITLGDIKETNKFSLSGSVNYLNSISKGIDLGLSVGFTNYFGTAYNYITSADIVLPQNGLSKSFLPIAAAAKISLSEDLEIGADVGYALGLSNNSNNGLYYKIQLGNNIENFGQIFGYFNGIEQESFTANSLGVGFSIDF